MKKKKRETKRRNNAAAVLRWILFTRHYLLQFPLLSAIFAFLLFFAAFSVISPLPPVINQHRSSQLKNGAKADESTFSTETSPFRVPRSGGRRLWNSMQSKFYYGCSNASDSFQTADLKTNRNRYLLIATSGGLNQQRTGITDGVVAAYILNATLVVPKLDQKSFWNDSSDFAEIFDVDWFISFLSKDVTIIKQLPAKGGKVLTPYRTRAPRKCTPICYLTKVLPVLNKKHVIQLGKFDYRLSNRLSPDLQKLRSPLKALFPNIHSKETLASKRELAPFSSYSSRMAALDFIVCDESDVFSTNNNGNMAKIIAGRRRYFGHKPTIRPNVKKLYKLFTSRHNKTWEEFMSKVRSHQIGFMGEPNELKPGRGEFHENPSSCLCEDSVAKAATGPNPTPQTLPHEGHKNGKENIKRNEASEVTDEHSIENEHGQGATEMDYMDNGNAVQGKSLAGEMLSEEFFSD
ncbi:hypothetical protein OIU77_029177 [Salix suchowensis]|uniref:O-fucosyltransferase family protein n=1 Tax=Salix suchowensis TaxID=1278906 RepID=A0ABQ9BN90_9ROSI|nr:hypothetical protein OIU77_029177 [Salix suchowensis]